MTIRIMKVTVPMMTKKVTNKKISRLYYHNNLHNNMFNYIFKAEFVVLVSLKGPSGW